MTNFKYENMAKHMKGFIQGLLFILIIIIIIAFFHVIGYVDRIIIGNDYSAGDDGGLELWNEDIERSEGIRTGTDGREIRGLNEKPKRDFGSKSLNQQDKEKAEKEKTEEKKNAYDYLKQ